MRPMFLLPFLKYFKPFLWRIAVAIVGMIMVALLSAAPIFIGGEAVKILLHHGRMERSDKGEGKNEPTDAAAILSGVLGTSPKVKSSSKDEATSVGKTVVRRR